MKKLTLTALFLVVTIGASNARADSYTAAFTCSASTVAGGCPWYAFPSAAEVSFSSSNDMAVTIGTSPAPTALFNISLPAADSPTDAYTWSFFSNGNYLGHSTDSVLITDTTTNLVTSATVSNDSGYSLPFCGDLDYGSLTFSPASADAPEPSAVLLMIAGIGLLAVFVRKRLMSRAA